jgi:chromosome segregation protein
MEDLVEALGSLEKLVAELEAEIESRFRTTLSKMSEEFGSYFRLMFGGGSARLLLSRIPSLRGGEEEEKDDTEEGISISVELPQKKIKNLSTLSGGERTLVSIALLFALVAVRRPPFLVLDEIDAALDETNSQRFIRLLKKLSSQAQFLIITHNRETMRGADALYGVSQKDGISHLLSISLTESAAVPVP